MVFLCLKKKDDEKRSRTSYILFENPCQVFNTFYNIVIGSYQKKLNLQLFVFHKRVWKSHNI